MKQQDVPGARPVRPAGVKWLEGYGTGELLTIMEAIQVIFRRRGLEVTFTALAIREPDGTVVH